MYAIQSHVDILQRKIFKNVQQLIFQTKTLKHKISIFLFVAHSFTITIFAIFFFDLTNLLWGKTLILPLLCQFFVLSLYFEFSFFKATYSISSCFKFFSKYDRKTFNYTDSFQEDYYIFFKCPTLVSSTFYKFLFRSDSFR